MAKVSSPSVKISGELLNHLLDTGPSGSLRKFSDTVLKTVERAWCNPYLLEASREAEPEERSLPWPRYRTLRMVYLQFESQGDKPGNTLHYPFACTLTFYIDVAIIGISHKTMFPSVSSCSVDPTIESNGDSGPCGVPFTVGLTSPFAITPEVI